MVMKSRAYCLVIFLWSTFLYAGGVPSRPADPPVVDAPVTEGSGASAQVTAATPTHVATAPQAGAFMIPVGDASAGAPQQLVLQIVNAPHAIAAPVVTAGASATNATQVTTMVSAVSHSFSSAAQDFKALLQQHNIPSNSGEWGGFFRAHKKSVIIGSVVVTYATLYGVLVSGNRYAHRDDLWANWQPLMSLKELQEFAQPELQKKLCEDVLKTYLLKEKSRIGAYLRFMKEIEKEEKRLSRYTTLSQWIKRSGLSRLFPITEEKVKRARSLKKRLAFIEHIFISWSAQQDF